MSFCAWPGIPPHTVEDLVYNLHNLDLNENKTKMHAADTIICDAHAYVYICICVYVCAACVWRGAVCPAQ